MFVRLAREIDRWGVNCDDNLVANRARNSVPARELPTYGDTYIHVELLLARGETYTALIMPQKRMATMRVTLLNVSSPQLYCRNAT